MNKNYWYVVGIALILLAVIWAHYGGRGGETILPGVKDAKYTNEELGFALVYPKTAHASEVEFAGYLPRTFTPVASFVLPESMYEGTNLGEAGVYVGATSSPALAVSCVEGDKTQGEAEGVSERIGDKEFRVFSSTDAGAGNFYERTSYRTFSEGVCLEFVTLLHSGNIGNYPPDTVEEFDRKYFQGILDAIIGTIRFE